MVAASGRQVWEVSSLKLHKSAGSVCGVGGYAFWICSQVCKYMNKQSDVAPLARVSEKLIFASQPGAALSQLWGWLLIASMAAVRLFLESSGPRPWLWQNQHFRAAVARNKFNSSSTVGEQNNAQMYLQATFHHFSNASCRIQRYKEYQPSINQSWKLQKKKNILMAFLRLKYR